MRKYDSIIQSIFAEHYVQDATSFTFGREELSAKAEELHIQTPKNLGYTHRQKNLLGKLN